MLTAEEYRRVDAAYDGDLARAMDRAGHAVALAAVRAGASYGRRVAILAGPGNNGGDGYVAARYLKHRGAHVVVRAMAAPVTEISADAEAKATAAGVPMRSIGRPSDEDVVVDALFGGGVRSGLPGEVLTWMGTGAPVVAVDYPTGLDPDTGEVPEKSFHARETVTFSTIKTGHVLGAGPDHCGRVTVADIGIVGGEPSMLIAEEADAPRPSRAREAHKWSAGSVLVAGGSQGLVGASIFAGKAALAFGAGSVYVAAPRPGLVQQIAPELPAMALDDAVNRLDRFDVVIAGPGLDPDEAHSIAPLLRRANRVVLDAGGLLPDLVLAAVEGDAGVVITPHAGEFQRVAGRGGGAYAIRAFARDHGVTVLLKGSPTKISDGGLPVLVTSGGAELASIGTGDVLAGMIGALWARGLDSTTAAVSGAYWHGIAGTELSRTGTVTAKRLVDVVGAYAW